MNTVHMKIVGYDDISHSLLVCFASDTTKYQDPEKYQPIAFQPSLIWPDVTDPEEIKKLISQAGIAEVQAQVLKEKLEADTARISAMKSMIGQTNSYQVSTLTNVATFANEVIL